MGAGRRDDRSVFSPPPGLTVSVLTSVLALRPKNKIVIVAVVAVAPLVRNTRRMRSMNNIRSCATKSFLFHHKNEALQRRTIFGVQLRNAGIDKNRVFCPISQKTTMSKILFKILELPGKKVTTL